MAEDLAGARRYLAMVMVVTAIAAFWTYRQLPAAHFQSEIDVIRASAARNIAEWFPDFTDTAKMINAPALFTSGTSLPGVWLYHVAMQLLVGPSPGWQMVIAGLLHLFTAFCVSLLVVSVTGDRKSAWAGAVFALHPAVGDLSATFSNGPAILCTLWVVQSGRSFARFVKFRAYPQLFICALCVFMAVGTDPIGLFAIPLIIGVNFAVAPELRRARVAERAVAILTCVTSVMMFYIALEAIKLPFGQGNPIDLVVAANRPMAIGRGLLFALKALTLPMVTADIAAVMGAFLGTALLSVAVFRGLDEPRRFVPVMLFLPAVMVSLPFLTDPAADAPQRAVGYLMPLLCASWIAGDIISAFRKPGRTMVLVGSLVVVMALFANARMQLPLVRGERVKAVGDEVHRIYNRLTNEADIYLIDDGYDRAALLAGHLDFVYRYGLTRQTRISLVDGGFMLAGSNDAPVGYLNGGMRLEVTDSMVFIGWDRSHEGLFQLDELIEHQLSRAEQFMQETSFRTAPFSLGGEGAVRAWPIRSSTEPAGARESYQWYIEAPISRLHPLVGNKLDDWFT
ncbi:hypothetical protein KDL45_03735 [bacterium]|nr:hypothetical protein [bacterium]